MAPWLVAIVALLCAGRAMALAYAPVDRPGPVLSVPTAQLRAALSCTGGVSGARSEPVLLVPGTTVDPRADFGWNWMRALTARHRPFCTIDLPGNGMADIQTAGEYVVYAIRTMHRLARRRIEIVGHSQGGMVPRWALRFWPDTRAMVDDLIGLSASNHGTIDAEPLCALGCAPAVWQQRDNAAFIAALNSGQETFAGISYTEIYTYTDEVVVPNSGPAASSAVDGGGGAIANIAIQQLCPGDLSEHLGVGTYDGPAYAIALDALTHRGPAQLQRVSGSVCAQALMPGVDPLTFFTDFGDAAAVLGRTLLTYPHVPVEPALACYAAVRCPTKT
jgi:pimeloyl-ACP methyl ester carboxylesterase